MYKPGSCQEITQLGKSMKRSNVYAKTIMAASILNRSIFGRFCRLIELSMDEFYTPLEETPRI